MTAPKEDTTTHVYGEIEVKKTGREAEKGFPGGTRLMTVVEITPANESEGTWKRWVNPSTLFEIKDPQVP